MTGPLLCNVQLYQVVLYEGLTLLCQSCLWPTSPVAGMAPVPVWDHLQYEDVRVTRHCHYA